MDKPQVLVFIDWYSPGYKAGGPVRSVVNMVDHLRDRIDFHIVTSDTDYTADAPYRGIVPDQWTTLPGGERVWYASKQGTSVRTWKRLVRQQEWSALYVNGIYSRWFSIAPLWLSRGLSVRKVVAVRGMLASGAMQHSPLKKLLFLSLARTFDLYKDVLFQATNDEEAVDIRKHLLQRAEVAVVPNLPRLLSTGTITPIAKEPGSLRLVSVGRIALEKNTLFAIERLQQVKGHVTFDLYGSVYDEAYWDACKKAIAALPANILVSHKGAVPPEEVPALLGKYHALYMPSAGENFGHTMLEALSAGRPLLISDRTPWRDLERQHAGWDLPLSVPEEFITTIDALCAMDQGHYDEFVAGAAELGAQRLSDRTVVEKSLLLLGGR